MKKQKISACKIQTIYELIWFFNVLLQNVFYSSKKKKNRPTDIFSLLVFLLTADSAVKKDVATSIRLLFYHPTAYSNKSIDKIVSSLADSYYHYKKEISKIASQFLHIY